MNKIATFYKSAAGKGPIHPDLLELDKIVGAKGGDVRHPRWLSRLLKPVDKDKMRTEYAKELTKKEKKK